MTHWSVPPDWRGETAFIVAGGPSVAGLDLSPLAGQRVIAINSSYEVAPFAQYLIFADVRWWDEHKARPELQAFTGEIVAVHSTAKDQGRHRLKRLKRAKPADDPLPTDRRTVAVRYTTVTAAIGLAVHLGAARIVLIGVDQRRGPEGQCHHHPPHRWRNKPGDTSWDRQLPELKLLAAPLRERGIEVINASEASRIDWWPKRTLPDALAADMDEGSGPAMQFYRGPRGGIREDDYRAIWTAARGAARALEFGPGGSTFAFVEAGVPRIVTCEHTTKWLIRARQRFAAHPAVHVLRYTNAAEVTVEAPIEPSFDLALVDSPAGEGRRLVEQPGQEGMNRLNTVQFALSRAPLVLLHDARREREQRTLDHLRGLGHRVEMIETAKGIAWIERC